MNNRYATPRAKSGFTLIEMLVVIGVIALLAAISFPVFSRVREGARATSCANNLRQLGLAFKQYLQDNNGRFPGAGQYQKWGTGGHWVSGVNGQNVADLNSPRGPIVDTASPTGYKIANVEKGALFPYVKESKAYVCPSNEEGEKKLLSYSMNCAIAGMGEQRVKEPSNIILLVDEGKANDGYLYTTGDGSAGTSTDELSQIHNGSGNLLFVDGHVKGYPFKVFPMTSDNAAVKLDTTPGKIRFEDKAFGPKGYYDSGNIFGSCLKPDFP